MKAAGNVMCAGGRGFEKLATKEKKKLIENLLSGSGQGRTGQCLTSFARALNDIHREDSEFFASILEPGFKHWVESVDFGELKEAVETSAEDSRAIFAMLNRVIWQYPAKVVLLFSLFPSLVNMLSDGLKTSFGKLNEVPPDLLTDIFISLVKEIDSVPVSGLLNELTEIGRKLHTGSALLGEPGAPLLPKALSDKLEEIASQMDADIFWKGRIALAEIKDAFDLALAQAVENHPDYLRLKSLKGPELCNIHVRSQNRKLSLWENLEDESLNEMVVQCLSAYDVQEYAELFNNRLRLLNRAWEIRPEACNTFIMQFIGAVDYDALSGAATSVFDTAEEELKDLVKPLVPGLVEWICETLQPREDDDSFDPDEDNTARARKALRALLMAEEVN